MALVSAPQRGPLGATQVDYIKQITVFTEVQNISIGVDDVDGRGLGSGADAPVYNDFGGELSFSHARISVTQAAFEFVDQAFDGVSVLDIRLDGTDPSDSIFPADPITGEREYISIRANTTPDFATWNDGNHPDDPVSFVFEFPEGVAAWPNGSHLRVWPISAPHYVLDNAANDSARDHMARNLAITIYAYPTGR